MARLKSGSFPTYRLYKRTGQAIVTIDGKDHYLGKHDSAESKAAYDRLISEWLARGRTASPPSVTDEKATLTVSKLIAAYHYYAATFYKDSPQERHRIQLALRPLRRLYGRTPAADFRPLALQAVRKAMLEPQQREIVRKPRNGKVAVPPRVVEYFLSRRTINQRIDVIKRMFKWAVSQELVPPFVFEGLRTVEGLKKGRSTAKEPRRVPAGLR